MRHFPIVPARNVSLAVLVSTIAVLVTGCAAPSISMRHFPALSADSGTIPTTTGSIKPRPVQPNKAPVQRLAIAKPKQQPAQLNSDAASTKRVPEQKQALTTPPQHRPDAYNNPPTYDPLPRYSRPNTERRRYQWNGTHQRRVIDNRQYVPKPRSKVLVSKSGRRAVQVGHGDTLFAIAKRHGLTVRQLMNHNRLRRSEIRVGQILLLPTGAL